MVFGDYDVDGNCATAILWQTLMKMRDLRVATKSDCNEEKIKIPQPFIPHRQKHGYGLNERSLKEILAMGMEERPDLIVTVDNGVTALETVEKLYEAGIEVIVTDHHQAEIGEKGEKVWPKAEAVLHSTEVCGEMVS